MSQRHFAGRAFYLPVPTSCTVCVPAASLMFKVAVRAPGAVPGRLAARSVCTILNTYTRISEECPMAIHSVELWLKGLAAAIGGAAMPKTTPRPGRLSVSQAGTFSGEPSGTSVSPPTPVQ
jgi:hypothetical protein